MAQSDQREKEYNTNDDHSDERQEKKSIIFMSVIYISTCIRKEINEYRQSFEKKTFLSFLIYYFSIRDFQMGEKKKQ